MSKGAGREPDYVARFVYPVVLDVVLGLLLVLALASFCAAEGGLDSADADLSAWHLGHVAIALMVGCACQRDIFFSPVLFAFVGFVLAGIDAAVTIERYLSLSATVCAGAGVFLVMLDAGFFLTALAVTLQGASALSYECARDRTWARRTGDSPSTKLPEKTKGSAWYAEFPARASEHRALLGDRDVDGV